MSYNPYYTTCIVPSIIFDTFIPSTSSTSSLQMFTIVLSIHAITDYSSPASISLLSSKFKDAFTIFVIINIFSA